MVELRQQNYGVKDIARKLNAEGFRMGRDDDEITPFKIKSLLDSNGTERALTVVVGAKQSEGSPLADFVRMQTKADSHSRVKMADFRTA